MGKKRLSEVEQATRDRVEGERIKRRISLLFLMPCQNCHRGVQIASLFQLAAYTLSCQLCEQCRSVSLLPPPPVPDEPELSTILPESGEVTGSVTDVVKN